MSWKPPGRPASAALYLLAKAAAGDQVDERVEQRVAGEHLDEQAPVHVRLAKVHCCVAGNCMRTHTSVMPVCTSSLKITLALQSICQHPGTEQDLRKLYSPY